MELVKAGHQILKGLGVYQHIELCGRTCYKSEDKITDDSAEKFVGMLIGKGHEAMIEHANFAIRVNQDIFDEFQSFNCKYINLSNESSPILSGSARGLKDLYNEGKVWENGKAVPLKNNWALDYIISYLKIEYPILFSNIEPTGIVDLKNEPTLLMEDEILNLSVLERKLHQYMSVKFICDRGVTHELVRHRPVSFAQESTRYVNYSKDKAGKQIRFIDIDNAIELDQGMKELLPEDINRIRKLITEMEGISEHYYMRLIQAGATPQIARAILTNSTKSEIIMTAPMGEWIDVIFRLRCSPAAHPAMREIMIGLKKEVATLWPEMF